MRKITHTVHFVRVQASKVPNTGMALTMVTSINLLLYVLLFVLFMIFFGYPSIVQYQGHPCKIGNMRCPGTLKNQNPQFEEKNKLFCFFMFLYPIQEGKNIGSPYLTNKSWFFGKSDVPGQQNKSYIGVMASKNLIFLMF